MNISILQGDVSMNEDDGDIVVMVGGVGYRVVVTEDDRKAFHLEPHVVVRVRTVVKEDSITLYGFREGRARNLFDVLLRVSGVGPKMALRLLQVLGAESLANAIICKNADRLRVSGIGPKTAQKIIDEVKL